ncbi:GNAT family N-acetyltransferase [Streptomyces sp. WMMB 322]|uniref:GNAT family N-acetyltransferase n=1 Tax=Streptomyces sp. WMMB 322 TaxID=1286821 RepID=UPI0006E3948C|nr:GNAT family N-acetyltransferase [Streptomyces sp. WMMB 322]SCK35939.1 Ribosomal protein S18 acetylase RimI [Streptomyces sp. WMMB 322]
MEITVRPAVGRDLASLLALYRELNPDDAPLSQESADAIWTGIAEQQGRTVLVAEVAGAVVGTADCMVLPNLTRGGRAILFVENVVVDGSSRRRGVGQRLMEATVHLGESAGCYKVQLLAADDEYVHTFYESCGFKPLAQGFRRYIEQNSPSRTVV